MSGQEVVGFTGLSASIAYLAKPTGYTLARAIRGQKVATAQSVTQDTVSDAPSGRKAI